MIRKMTGAQLTGSVSLNFIRQMIPHHRAAVQMSENLLKYRGSGPLAKIAENIITVSYTHLTLPTIATV